MEMPNISVMNDYKTYGNGLFERKNLSTIASIFEDKLIEEVTNSPFFSIILDESTNGALEQHLIIYVTHLENDGIGQFKTKLLNLASI